MPVEQQGKAASDHLQILVVEDNFINQKLLRMILAKRGHETDIAENGVEAVEAVLRKAYDLVFMDIAMPEMDGFEAARSIRDKMNSPHLPVIIAVTAYAREEDQIQSMASGMQDYLSKPFRIPHIDALLDKWTPYIHTYKSKV
ncbi:response regulator [Paenibacillus lutrae]|uniref:Response regulator n=1 Tax=Paenibacillus lutrae TaxID=2078573 RepID=A0A7X3K0I7_9BACL|nr:response regulator [Paenibacillus lutrae]MVP01132.1 response regulator [Paenibacillus lutrae]